MKPFPLYALAGLALLASCQSTLVEETFIRADIADDSAPEWVKGRIETMPGHVSFVGRGGGFNVLDERAAFDEALGHARAQLSHYVSTKVVAEACLRDISIGARFLPHEMHEAGRGESVDQSLKSCAHEVTEAVVGGVAAADQHWERWDVRTEELPGGMRRYKCWVLSHVDSADIDRYVDAALQALMNRAAVEEAERNLAAQQAEIVHLESTVGAREAQIDLGVADLERARALLAAQTVEVQRLRERVYYGRRFRLIENEDCLHYRDPCSFDMEHPEWRVADVVTRTELAPYGVEVPVVVREQVEVPRKGCLDCGEDH
jgi:hypothetical protein